MSIRNNNILAPLAFYTDVKFQDRRRFQSFGEIFPLVASSTNLLPFQFITTAFVSPSVTTTITPVGADGTDGTPTSITLTGAGGASLGNGYAVYHYNGATLNTPLKEGRYYLHITISQGGTTENYYSEVFTIVDASSLSQYLKLEWWDEGIMEMDNGALWYSGTIYKNVVYLPTSVGKPTYQLEEEGEERNGYFFAEKQISRKQYTFTFLAPEYLCDALRLTPMHPYITITDNGIEYNANQIGIDVEWQTQGNLASVTATFYCNTVAKMIGRTIPILSGGDFNDDYNDDFNNQ